MGRLPKGHSVRESYKKGRDRGNLGNNQVKLKGEVGVLLPGWGAHLDTSLKRQ